MIKTAVDSCGFLNFDLDFWIGVGLLEFFLDPSRIPWNCGEFRCTRHRTLFLDSIHVSYAAIKSLRRVQGHVPCSLIRAARCGLPSPRPPQMCCTLTLGAVASAEAEFGRTVYSIGVSEITRDLSHCLRLYCIIKVTPSAQGCCEWGTQQDTIGQWQQGEHKIIYGYRVEINCIVIWLLLAISFIIHRTVGTLLAYIMEKWVHLAFYSSCKRIQE